MDGVIRSGCSGLYAGAEIVRQVAKHAGSTYLSENLKDMYTRIESLSILTTFINRTFAFATAGHAFLKLNVLSGRMQNGMSAISRDLKGYADSTYLAAPFNKIWEFKNSSNALEDNISNMFLGYPRADLTKDLVLAGITKIIKSSKGFADGFSFISARLFNGFSLASFAPKASTVFSWVIGDKVACASCVANIYLDVKDMSIQKLGKAASAIKAAAFTNGFSDRRIGDEDKRVVTKTLDATLNASLLVMGVCRIFADRVGKNRALGLCQVLAIGTCMTSSILLNRWTFMSKDVPASQQHAN